MATATLVPEGKGGSVKPYKALQVSRQISLPDLGAPHGCSERRKQKPMSGEFPERECDIEKLCLIVRHPGSETSLLGQHIHTTQHSHVLGVAWAAC